ncbi:MAG: CDP-glycerol glycerophosphotransferase family protein [Deltaproteobacteria bacterium]|jgi:SAM-dependent methyltransferase|nr:CDP-glycerol glycerophosphotransferase family protein [Deltaproteobacteria bacterium]
MNNYRIAFDTTGVEIHFILDIITSFLDHSPQVRPYFTVTHAEEAQLALQHCPSLAKAGDFIAKHDLDRGKHPDIKVWVSTEQYRRTDAPVRSYCCFHGQPSKGQTLVPSIDGNYTGFFLYGPLHRQAIEEYYHHRYGKMPENLRLYNVGYAKSDALLNGAWQKEAVLRGMGLDPGRPTILYAPAFNEGASLRECGPEIVARLAALKDYNTIVKLAVDNASHYNDFRRNGGINWFAALSGFERYPHVRISRDLLADPFLAAADVLITDISSISYEFLVLGKPVIFMDVPKFFQHTLKMQFPHEDTAAWISRPTVNAGRDYGSLVADLDALPREIRAALDKGQSADMAAAMREKFLYHPGKAARQAAKLLGHLLREQAGDAPRPRRHAPPARNAGHAFINAVETEEAAQRAGLSLNAYLESQEDTPKKRGRRDRIMAAMEERGLLDLAGKTVLEIGPGTGRYTEKILELQPARCEIYETAEDWTASLLRRFGATPGFAAQAANGRNLIHTPTATCDLVHAHAVFVYLSFINTVEYLMEISRVCKTGGHVCFDLFYDTDWSLFTARSWLLSGFSFPVVLSRSILESVYADLGLALCGEFTEIYGASLSRYVVLRKDRLFF